MKIMIKASCIGKDGEHLQEGTTLADYDDETAVRLIRLGRAVGDAEAKISEGGDQTTSEADALLKLTKAELLELAAAEEVEIKASANKEQIAEAILLKRSAAA